MYMETTWH